MGESLFLVFSHSCSIFAEYLYIFSSLIFFISIYAIFNFYYDIFLLVPADQGLKILSSPIMKQYISIQAKQIFYHCMC